MARTTTTIIIISLSTFLLSVSSHPSPYEALQQYNFPVGLLPKGATGYTLSRATGEFTAYLNGSCSFALENSSYRLKYEPVIKGVISRGRLQKLSGVSVKVLVLWLNIVEVKRNDEDLEFSVGITSANFPSHQTLKKIQSVIPHRQQPPHLGHKTNLSSKYSDHKIHKP
ncbi:hypothetical protein DH2020_046090 [Rehmannia glutinosa]|uniref:Uncharacterized protein n=1 Tax=Rehmannia glutinosa TaxID=99300 RepID=A0ABR0UCD4_REHGL